MANRSPTPLTRVFYSVEKLEKFVCRLGATEQGLYSKRMSVSPLTSGTTHLLVTHLGLILSSSDEDQTEPNLKSIDYDPIQSQENRIRTQKGRILFVYLGYYPKPPGQNQLHSESRWRY